MIKALFLFLGFPGFSLDLAAQTQWLMNDNRNPNYFLTIVINDSIITGTTRKDALIDYVGESKFNMIRAMSALKYPEIIHFSAGFKDKSRQIFAGTFNNLFSEKKMEGRISGDSIWINLISPGSPIETITGVRKYHSAQRTDYTAIINSIFSLTEEKLYDPRFIQSEQWIAFKKIMLTNSQNIPDDLELQVGLIALARDFPFTHYSLVKTSTISQLSSFKLTELNPATCVITIPAFIGTRKQMDSILTIVQHQKYANLIIDLRNNGGGDNESAAPLLEFIAAKEMIIGIFPNKTWYNKNLHSPTREEYKSFTSFKNGTLDQFYAQAENDYGLFLQCIPSEKHFAGNVFVVTNKNTASTSEIITLALLENKLATIVGQTTAGAALSGKKFRINDQFSLFLPQNDYISYGGFRIDKKGVKPDIIVKNEDEIQYILKSLIK